MINSLIRNLLRYDSLKSRWIKRGKSILSRRVNPIIRGRILRIYCMMRQWILSLEKQFLRIIRSSMRRAGRMQMILTKSRMRWTNMIWIKKGKKWIIFWWIMRAKFRKFWKRNSHLLALYLLRLSWECLKGGILRFKR